MATVNSEQSVEISPWLSCRSPVLLSTDTCSLSEFLHVGSGLRWADGPSSAVTKILAGQAGAGSGPQTAAKQVHLAFAMPSFGQMKRDVAAVRGEGSVTSVRSRRMWRHGALALG
jgi:hypothetical protein